MNITQDIIKAGRSLSDQAHDLGLELIQHVNLSEGVLAVYLYKRGGGDIYGCHKSLEDVDLWEILGEVQAELDDYKAHYEQRRREEIERMRAEVAAYDKEGR